MSSSIDQLRARLGAIGEARPAWRVEVGSRRDYDALAHHHYRAGKPATATRVLVVRDRRPTPVDRMRGAVDRDDPGEVAAVLVESLPSLSCRLRDAALADRYRCLAVRSRVQLLNREVRTISRVVVDPRYRGQGLAVALVRHALRTATTAVTEAVAAMGKVSPFFERAGMRAYRRPPLPCDSRLMDVLTSSGLGVSALVDPEGTAGRLQDEVFWGPVLRRELRRYHRQSCGRSRARDSDDPVVHLRTVRQRVLLQPVYYLFRREGGSTGKVSEVGELGGVTGEASPRG
ncbi:MAG: GNAT family N-acetyltransferase [Planctomycetota bacterium]